MSDHESRKVLLNKQLLARVAEMDGLRYQAVQRQNEQNAINYKSQAASAQDPARPPELMNGRVINVNL